MDFKQKVADLLFKDAKVDKEKALALLTIPPAGMGDYTFPCFIIAKEMKKNPVVVASKLAPKFLPYEPE